MRMEIPKVHRAKTKKSLASSLNGTCTQRNSTAAMLPPWLAAQALVSSAAFVPVAGACQSWLARRGPLDCAAVNDIPKETSVERVTDCFKLQSLHKPSMHDL